MAPDRVSLPLDIYHDLFNILAEQHDYEALKSCLLLCRDLQPLCRRSLFRRVDIAGFSGHKFPDGNHIPVEKLHSLLINETTAIVGSYVQTLYLNLNTRLRDNDGTILCSMVKEKLPEVLAKLSNVKTFRLTASSSQKWGEYTPTLFRLAVENIVTSPCLVIFDISWILGFPINELVEKSSFIHLRYGPISGSDSSPSPTRTRRCKTIRLKSLVLGFYDQAILDVVNSCSPEGKSLFDWTSLQVLDFFIEQPADAEFAKTMLTKCVNLSEVKCVIHDPSYLGSFLDPIYASHRHCQLRTITIHLYMIASKNAIREFAIGLDRFPQDNTLHEFEMSFYAGFVESITVEELADVLDGGIALLNDHFKKEVFPNLEKLTIKLVADFKPDPLIKPSAVIEVVVEKWFPSLQAQYGRGFQFFIIPEC